MGSLSLEEVVLSSEHSIILFLILQTCFMILLTISLAISDITFPVGSDPC